MSLNFDAIHALTKKKHLPRLVDNFFRSNPFLAVLRDKEQAYDGGPSIIEPIIHGQLNHVTSYAGYDVIQYDQTIPITAAEFRPKNIVAPIIISRDEELQNMGDNQVLNLLDAKYQIAEETLKASVSTMLYGDGTGNSGKDLDGLGIAVSATGTYGGINRATYAWWRAHISANAGTPIALTIPRMLSVYLTISDGNDQPTMMLCGNRTWGTYHELLRTGSQLTTEFSRKMAGLGFQTLEFMGKPIVADANCPEGRIYFLNDKYFKWRPHSSSNFVNTKFRQADDMIAKRQEILLTGNITFNNMRRHGMLGDITLSI